MSMSGNTGRRWLALLAAGAVACGARAFAEEGAKDSAEKPAEPKKEQEVRAVQKQPREKNAPKDEQAKKRCLDERIAGVERKLEQSRAQLKELQEAGKTDEAQSVQRRIEHLEQELAQMRHCRANGGRGPGPRPDPMAAEARLRHLREAVSHLRAAGMNEPAERLNQEAQRMEQQLRKGPEGRDGSASPEEIAKLRNEVQELRRMVRQLQAKVAEEDDDDKE